MLKTKTVGEEITNTTGNMLIFRPLPPVGKTNKHACAL